MHSLPLAALMATESVRRNLTEPPRVRRRRRPRRVAARVLHAAAHRLDPCVAHAPRTAAG
jgi:hypothetical protein